MNKFELGDKAEICNVPPFPGERPLNGLTGIIVALPGYDQNFPECYGLEVEFGIINANPKFIRPYPPKLPNGRADIDNKTTWAEFDKATGLDSRTFREGFDATPA